MLAQNGYKFFEQRIYQLFAQIPEHQKYYSKEGESNSERKSRSVVIHFDRVLAGCEINAKQSIPDGNDLSAFAVHLDRPAFAVGDGREHDTVVGSGDCTLEMSVAVFGDVPLILAHGCDSGVQSVVVHFGDEDISAACGRGFNGDANLCSLGKSAHVDDIRFIGCNVPVGTAHLYINA